MLRGWFGPSKKKIWRQLSDQLNARFVDGGWWTADKVTVNHREWTVVLDTCTVSTGKTVVVFTRMRAPYGNPDGFRFNIYHRGFFSGIGTMFGMQDVEVGSEQFDDEFIIKGNHEATLRQLFANSRIRELISSQKNIRFSVKDDEGWFGAKLPEGVDGLTFIVAGVIKDIERLKQLHELFSATLDELCRMGSAYETNPGVSV